MSSNQIKIPFHLTICFSTQKCCLIVIPHLIIFILCLTIGTYLLIPRLIIATLIILSLVYYLRQHIFLSLQKSIIAVSTDSMKNWFLTLQDGSKKSVNLLDTSFANKWLIILNYADINNRKNSVFFTPDSLSIEDFRRLIVRLKVT